MKIRLIKMDDSAALVEYRPDGDVRRVIIPSSAAHKDECDEEILRAGIEYGEDWEKHIGELSLDGALRKLRKMGIWTWEDLERNPLAIKQALNATVEKNIQNVLRTLAIRLKSEK